MRSALAAAYRRTGADLPGGDPRPSHGAEMEGWFWRLTDRTNGRVVVALCGVNRHPEGDWATVALAAHPGGFVRSAAVDGAAAAHDDYHVVAGDVLEATAEKLRVDFGPDARLDVRFVETVGWPLRLGGGGIFSALPFLGQYWHPHVLDGHVEGALVLGDERWDLSGATPYAEKNWGRGGFPDRWWWGQAQAFDRDDVCVAFGGGVLRAGPAALTVTGAVVRLGERVIRWAPPFAAVRTSVGDGRWSVRARRPGWEVVLEGDGNGTEPHVLPVPLPRERRNVDRDLEHLAGRLRCVVRRRGRVLFEGTSLLAALEVGSLAGPLPGRG